TDTDHFLCSHAFDHSALSYFLFNAQATPEIYTLSLHDALPIYVTSVRQWIRELLDKTTLTPEDIGEYSGTRKEVRPDIFRCQGGDRKSTRLNSSHVKISYAVFCLKKKCNKKGDETYCF